MSGLGYSYLYRPTPVVTLGEIPSRLGAEPVLRGYLAGLAAVMPHAAASRPGRSTSAHGDPWIHRSGVMRTFMGLGQDFVGPIDYSGLPDIGFSEADFSTINDAWTSGGLSDAGFQQILSGNVSPGNLGDFLATDPGQPQPATPGTVAQVPAGAGPTGFGVPATQSLAALAAAAASAARTRTPVPAGYVRTPTGQIVPASTAAAYGAGPLAFFAQSTILRGVSNGTVIFGGLAILALLGALSGKR